MCFRPASLDLSRSCEKCGASCSPIDQVCPECGAELPPRQPGASKPGASSDAPEAPASPAVPAPSVPEPILTDAGVPQAPQPPEGF